MDFTRNIKESFPLHFILLIYNLAMRYESLKENFYNIPYILSGKVISSISRKMTPIIGGYSPFPQVISFYLTERCNLNCRMCFLKNINYSLDFIPLGVAKKL